MYDRVSRAQLASGPLCACPQGRGRCGNPEMHRINSHPAPPCTKFCAFSRFRESGTSAGCKKGRCACLQPASRLLCDHEAAGCPDPSACVYLRKCTMVCGANAAVFVLCGSLVASAAQARDQIAGASLVVSFFGEIVCSLYFSKFAQQHYSIGFMLRLVHYVDAV